MFYHSIGFLILSIFELVLKQGQKKNNRVLGKLKAVMMQGEIVLAGREAVLTGRAKKVIELAQSESKSLGQQYIGTEHLLFGILEEGGGLAVEVMKDLGVNLGKVRDEILRTLQQKGDSGTQNLGEQE